MNMLDTIHKPVTSPPGTQGLATKDNRGNAYAIAANLADPMSCVWLFKGNRWNKTGLHVYLIRITTRNKSWSRDPLRNALWFFLSQTHDFPTSFSLTIQATPIQGTP